jgi:hypothetical protein
MIWFANARPARVASFGTLSHFRAEDAPAGAPARCTDGCPAAGTCLYYAPGLYLGLEPFWTSYAATAPRGLARWAARQAASRPGGLNLLARIYPPFRQITEYRGWPLSVLTPEPTPENILDALQTGPYGRCVYACGSDVVDHQTVGLLFERGTTATLTLHGHSPIEQRTTRIEGTRGRLIGMLGNGGSWLELELHGSQRKIHEDTSADQAAGHGGGDQQLMAEFTASVRAGGNPPEVQAAAQEALLAHRLAFLAEKARVKGKTIHLESGGEEIRGRKGKKQALRSERG